MTVNKITEYFEADHDRLDELFNDFQKHKRTNYPRARECFTAFQFGLQRHIVWEEEILFPLFEQKTATAFGGPTYVMRMEHRQIAEHLEAISNRVKIADLDTDEEEQKLLTALRLHNQKEEYVLYPAIDQATNEEEKEMVFNTMKNIPEERYVSSSEKLVL